MIHNNCDLWCACVRERREGTAGEGGGYEMSMGERKYKEGDVRDPRLNNSAFITSSL